MTTWILIFQLAFGQSSSTLEFGTEKVCIQARDAYLDAAFKITKQNAFAVCVPTDRPVLP